MEPLVIEKPSVGILMDIGQRHTQVERRAKENGLEWYGQNYHDYQHGNTEGLRALADEIYQRDPDSWENVARAQLLSVQSAQSDAERVDCLHNLAVVVLGWIDDIGRCPRPVLIGT